MRIYCTLFDGPYTARALALVDSLHRHCAPFRLHVLCMDNESAILLKRLDLQSVAVIRLDELEAEDKQLAAVKTARNSTEYYFTSKASLLRHVLLKNPDCERVTYLDADLYFFSDPAPIDGEIASRPVALTEHRFSRGNRRLYKFGRFNAGWLSIRNDDMGRQCVDWWRNRCLEWCHDYVEGDRYADQKYMDRFPELFNAIVVNHAGANLAPWNIGNHVLTHRGGKVYADAEPVIFFHFQGVRHLFGPFVESGLALYSAQLTSVARQFLFVPYLEKWREGEEKVFSVRQTLIEQGIIGTGEVKRKLKRGSLIDRLRILTAIGVNTLQHRTLLLSRHYARSKS